MPLHKNNHLGYKSRKKDWILVKLMHRVDMDATLKLTQGQVYKAKGQRSRSNSQLCEKCLGFKSGTNNCLFKVKVTRSKVKYAIM